MKCDQSCGCCSDLNGHLSNEQCLPDYLCQSQKAVGEECNLDAQCESMACVSSACQEFIPVVRRMLQTETPTTTDTTSSTDNQTTTNTTPTTPPTDNPTTTNTTTTTPSTNQTTTPTTNTTANVTEPEPYDPVSALNYTCFMCAQNSFAYDTKGCFNQSLLTKRFTSKSITTHKQCFANGYWIKTNNQFIQIPDTSKLTANETGLWNYSYQCNKTGDEFYLHVTNKQSQVNQLNASISSLSGTGVAGFLHTYCNGASGNNCSINDTTTGFSNYTTKPGEMIEFYLYCSGSALRNLTLTLSAQYLYTVVVEEQEEGLSGGGIAGIVIACIIVVVVAVGILLSQKGVGGLRCCKNRTQQIPDDSPRAPNDIDRRETGLAGNPDNAHNPVSIQPNSDGKVGRSSNAPLVDELMGATSAPFPGQDLNSTGQHLLASLKNQSHEYNTNADRNIGSAPGTGMPTSPSAQGGLPNIHVDKKGAAQQWNALDSDRRGKGGQEDDIKSSKRELTKDRSEGKE